MNTLTQAPVTGATIAKQAKAIAKAPKVKPVKATETAPAWYARYNERITAAKGELGTPITADEAVMGAAIGGPEGRPKRTTGDAAEALWLALTLRPGGCRKADYITIKGSHGFAMNCLHYASGNLSRALYAWVTVSQGADNAYISRLTPKGRAYAMRLGAKAPVADRMAKAYVAPTVKGDKPKAQPKAAKPRNGAAKPKGTGDKAPVNDTATPPKPASEPAKPVVTAPVADKPATDLVADFIKRG